MIYKPSSYSTYLQILLTIYSKKILPFQHFAIKTEEAFLPLTLHQVLFIHPQTFNNLFSPEVKHLQREMNFAYSYNDYD